MACRERELLEAEVKQAHKRWTDLEDKAGAAIGKADPNSNQYLAQAQRARAAAKKAQADLDDHLIFHRCGPPPPTKAPRLAEPIVSQRYRLPNRAYARKKTPKAAREKCE
jgi:hypothetical protein